MKRKTKDKIASYFWIGLVIIAIFLGLYTAGVFSDEPQFTITKEVCEEEHVFNEELGDYRYRLTIESFISNGPEFFVTHFLLFLMASFIFTSLFNFLFLSSISSFE